MLTSIRVAALALLAVPLPDSCLSCRVEGRQVRLCEPHAKTQSDALALHAAAVRDSDAAAARAAVIALEKSRDGHRNAVTAELSRAIARGLEHPSFEVRATVLLAFDKSLDAGVTEEVLQECTQAYPEQAGGLARRQAAAVEALGERTHTPIERLTLMGRFDALDREAPSLARESIHFQAYSDALFRLLGKRGDEGLDRMLELAPAAREGAVLPHSFVAGLVQRGRRDGVREGLVFLQDWQESRAELSRAIEGLEKRRLPSAPEEFEGDAEEWRAEATRQREERLTFLREALQAHDSMGAMLQASYGAMAIVNTRIEDAPPIGKTPYTEWRAWYRRHSKRLPERLAAGPKRR